MLLKHKLVKPFTNLTKQERFLQLLRLSSSCFAIVFCLTLLVGPIFNNNLYITRINCAHLDVSKGLYNSLRNSVGVAPSILEDSDTECIPVGSSLTNSEIKLLSEYAEAQVVGAPQYCTTSIWKWCYGNYQSRKTTNSKGKTITIKENEVLTCFKKKEHAFDYRSQLEDMQLDSILAYAYQGQDMKNSKYDQDIIQRNHRLKLALNGIIFTCCAQLMILCAALIIYSNRGKNERDLSKIPNITLHGLALVSVMACCSSIIASALITNLLMISEKEVGSELKNFGVFFTRGATWFTLLWLSSVCCVLTMAGWALPMWCANPSEEKHRHRLDDSILIGKYTQYF
ncbi:ECM7 [Candida oxycetoniae]|uniref:ECM7 n=1 Tax=Candida oxycetoniae TaxID=497107 RepID=A0AAI9SXA7_9ASCO|nr:ECM7 [Candida oxycetoniae]KAI3404807.2 ECM7 [Candida oxycetoniae]